MRIAILTLPLHTNYGGILQAYALQTVLERMGHEVELLEPARKRMHHPLLMPLVWVKRGIRKYIRHENVEIFRSAYERVSQYTEPFIINNIHRRFVRNWNMELADLYDAIVVGSDQIWRPKYCGFIDQAFLDFAKNSSVRRIAYAVSFGTAAHEYTAEQIERYKPLVQKFYVVSVREDSGIQLCKDYFDVVAYQVLDPTLLLSVSDYKLLLKDKNIQKSTGNLLVYILDENDEMSDFIQKVAREKGLQPFRANSKVEQYDAPINERIQPPVEQWIQGFCDAELVITDSFHACVFSILFKKPFLVIGNKDRGTARIDSLLHLLGLEQCLISLEKEMDRDANVVNWDRAYTKLKEKRKLSEDFLQQAFLS